MKEHYYDKLLHIKTGAYEKETNQSLHFYPYEPTEYRVLETLLDQYELDQNDCIVDFGSGKGRLCFFLHYYKHVFVRGVEMSEVFHKNALKNKKSYLKKTKQNKDKIQFYCSLAETYEIKDTDNRFYFFNPFSVRIFERIINNILRSVETFPREVELILYYPSEDYIFYLENQTVFQLKEEITLPGLYEKNPDERFLIYYI